MAKGPAIDARLREQREHLQPLLEISPTAIVISDLQTNVVAWNPAAEQLFGYPADEAIGRNLDDLVATTEELHTDAVAYSRRAKEPGDRIHTITRRTTKDGTLVDVELLAAPLVVDAEAVGILGVYHDITELQRQKQFYEALLEISPTAISTVDREDNVTSWNPAAERLFGYPAEEALGRNVDDLVAARPELRKEALKASEDIHSGEIRLTTRRTRKDGSLVDVSAVGGPIHVAGELVGAHAFYHDISELQEQKRYFQSILEISPVAIVVTDLDSNVVSWNPAAERLFGYASEEAVGRPLDDLVATRPEIHDEAVGFSRAAARGELVQAVARRTRKDGSLVDVLIVSAPVAVGEKRTGFLAMYQDVSELQQQKQWNESVLELSPTAIVTCDRENRVTSWNPAAERLFGYSSDEAMGQDVDDLVAASEGMREEAESITREALTGKRTQAITRRTRKDGTLVDVDMRSAPVFVSGERVGESIIYHDIGEIQQQRHYYESLLTVSLTAIVTHDLQNNVTSWNPAAEKLFGYTEAEAKGRDIDDLVARKPGLREEVERISRSAVAKGEIIEIITRRTRKDGTLVDVEVLGTPLEVRGERVGYHIVYHDISELQRQKRYYEALVQSSPVAIALLDPEGTVNSWNPSAERLFGYTAEEAIGQNIDDLVATSDEIRTEALSQTEQGMSGGFVHSVTRRTRKDGDLVDVEIFGAPVIVAGEPAGLYAMYHDIGELQRQRRYYESLVEASPIAVVLLDDEGTITSWNPAAVKLFGYTPKEAIGQNIDDVVATSAEIREEAEGYLHQALTGSGSAHAVTRRTRKDSTFVDVELLAVPVVIAGERVGFYVLYHDIGELQRARRDAEAATEAKSAFLATMSHEIRTPLNAVIGMTGLLLDTTLDAQQRNYSEVIRGSGDALLGVINDILDFSKIEAGRLDLEQAPFDLRECLESALELGAAAGLKKGLDIAYDLDPAAPGAVVGDVTRLRQIIINLLNNAVKFTERGEVVLTVTAEPLGGNRHRLHVAVRDTGIGIPEDRMDRLFESFTQVDPSTTRRYGGTGLGLAISRRLVEVMGGTMWAESRVGEGSTFHFTIEAEAAPAPIRGFEQASSPQLQGRRVLIVDDNATNRHILVRQTQAWGMIARDTESPAEALGWVRRNDPFDVAILDMQMPEMDGLTLAGEIRAHLEGRALPLVMLTSLGRTERSTEVEFDAYLTKPIKPSQLYDALLEVFGVRPELSERPDEPETGEDMARRAPLRILVVEDNAVNQQLALLLLQKIGYRADVAANGVEGLEALERQPYDVVLMDVEMPEMDGLEATRRIHQRWSKEQRPHIVAVTANALAEERALVFEAGMDDYIAKPIRIEELTGALDRVQPRVPGPKGTAPVDPNAIARLAASFGDQGAESVGGLIDTFLEHAPGHLTTLRAALERGDAGEVRRAAHTLKSNAATFGANALEEMSRNLEAKAKAGALDGGTDLVAAVERELARVESALRSVRQDLTT